MSVVDPSAHAFSNGAPHADEWGSGYEQGMSNVWQAVVGGLACPGLVATAVNAFQAHRTACWRDDDRVDHWSCEGCDWTLTDASEYEPKIDPGLAHSMTAALEAVAHDIDEENQHG